MARDVSDDTYYIIDGGKIPIKWTAPEVSDQSQIPCKATTQLRLASYSLIKLTIDCPIVTYVRSKRNKLE